MKSVEEIVKHKAYFELTPAEKEMVKDVAPNEDAYDNLKYLLESTTAFYQSNKVTAGSEMRDHIMEKLYPPTHSAVPWYQSFWFFLVPPQKPFYKYPILQFATVLILLFGIFTIWKNPLREQRVAQNVSQEKRENREDKNTEKEIVLLEKESKEPITEELLPAENESAKKKSAPIVSEELNGSTSTLEPVLAEAEMDDEANALEVDKDRVVAGEEITPSAPKMESAAVEQEMIVIDNKDFATTSIPETQERMVMKEQSDAVQLSSNSQFNSSVIEKSKKANKFNDESKKEPAINVTALKDLKELFFEVK